MRIVLINLFIFFTGILHAQELFTYTEPASNMAAKSIGVRANNYLMKDNITGRYDYQLAPEIMWGASKKIMIHVEGFFSNKDKTFKAEGASLYGKYRFYSQDDVHSHFRMAAYGKVAFNNGLIHHLAIDLNGYNSGYEGGVIATKLINKLALSASGSFVHAWDNGADHKFFPIYDHYRNAIEYTLSAGRLMLPVVYENYNQTNMNLMFEMLGQWNTGSGESYLDMAPSIQFIFLSRMRLDLGYRFPVVKDMYRMMDNSFLLRLEYNFFNVYK